MTSFKQDLVSSLKDKPPYQCEISLNTEIFRLKRQSHHWISDIERAVQMKEANWHWDATAMRVGSTPLERLRETWRAGTWILSFLGQQGLKPCIPPNGVGYTIDGMPFTVDVERCHEVMKGHFFKLKDPLQCDVESLFPLFGKSSPSMTSWTSGFSGKKGHHSPLGMVLRTWIFMQVR